MEGGRGDLKRLQGVEREWPLRVGEWRVIFTPDNGGRVQLVEVLRVKPRGGVYK